MTHIKFDDIKVEMVFDSVNENKLFDRRNSLSDDTTHSIPTDMHIPFNNNLFLNLIVNNREWKNDLKKEIVSKHGSMQIDKNGLTLKCTLNNLDKNFQFLAKNWTKSMNSVISNFMKDFHLDLLSLLEYDLISVVEIIKTFNKQNGYSVQYKEIKKKLHYVVHKHKLEQFKSILQTLVIGRPTSIQFQLPQLPDHEFYELIDPLLIKLKVNYTDIQITYDPFFRNILLIGSKNRVEEFQKLLEEYLRGYRSEKLRSVNEEAYNCSNMINMLEKIAAEEQILCKFAKKNGGFHLIYFQSNCIIDSLPIETFSRIETHIMQNYTSTKIDFLNSNDVLNGEKWSIFKNANLTSNPDITFNINSKEIIIFGRKKVVLTLDTKIQEFLQNNKQISSIKLNFSKNEVKRKLLMFK